MTTAWNKIKDGHGFPDGRHRAIRATRGTRTAPALEPGHYRHVIGGTVCCPYCLRPISESETTIDHIVPRSRGGNNDKSNKIAACSECNSRKSDLLPLEFFWGTKGKRPRIGLRMLSPRRRKKVNARQQRHLDFPAGTSVLFRLSDTWIEGRVMPYDGFLLKIESAVSGTVHYVGRSQLKSCSTAL
jgi:hypothetical protein